MKFTYYIVTSTEKGTVTTTDKTHDPKDFVTLNWPIVDPTFEDVSDA